MRFGPLLRPASQTTRELHRRFVKSRRSWTFVGGSAIQRGPMRRLIVARLISRRNHSKPRKKHNIAAMNSRATGIDASKLKKALRKRTAITVHTRSAVVVHSVMARPISFARRDSTARSARSVARDSGEAPSNLCSKTRARSMTRPSLLVMTARIAPIPVRRKTGATASSIAWATVTSENSSTKTSAKRKPTLTVHSRRLPLDSYPSTWTVGVLRHAQSLP